MKNKLFLFVFVTALAVTLAGCGQPATNQQAAQSNTNTQQNVNNAPAAQTQQTVSGTMNDLLKRGQPIKCVYSVKEKDFSQNGTIYAAGTKMRVNIETTYSDAVKNNMAYIIKIGDDHYMWGSEAQGKGTKFTFTEADEKAMQEKSQNQQNNENVDLNKPMDYKCDAWTVDESVFTPPTDIKFEDMTKIFKDMMNQADSMKSELCGMCNSLPAGAAKDQCVKSNCQ